MNKCGDSRGKHNLCWISRAGPITGEALEVCRTATLLPDLTGDLNRGGLETANGDNISNNSSGHFGAEL